MSNTDPPKTRDKRERVNEMSNTDPAKNPG
jgi:hypothetical protein